MEAHNKSLFKDIIEGTYRQYTIPVYQRNYTWEKKHCKQLFEDILEAIKNNRKHYLGSLVYFEKETYDSDEVFTFCHIIDGQQRLTTVILLLKAIYDLIVDKNNRIKIRIFNSLYNENCSENYKLKLKSVDNDNKELEDILLDNTSNLSRLSNVSKNYFYLKDLVKDAFKNGLDAEKLFKGVCSLEVVEIKLDGNDKPQLIFESINSTGKRLDNSELIRNFLLMGITNSSEQKNYYKKYWVKLHENLGVNNIESFFNDYLVMKTSSYINREELYDKFKRYYREQEGIDFVFEDIKKYSEYYKMIMCNNSKLYSKETNNLCGMFSMLEHNTIYPFLLRVCEDFKDITNLYKEDIILSSIEEEELKIRENEFNKIIRLLGNYALRRNICEVPSSGLRRFYASLYDNIFRVSTNKNNYYKSIEAYLCTINTSDRFPSDEVFMEHLIEVNMYKRSLILKMFFELIENTGNEVLNFDTLTIEHILPQNPEKGWVSDLGEEYQLTYDKYLNTLGNLSITGYNSEYKNKRFLVKKKMLLDKLNNNDLKVIKLNEELLDKSVVIWNEEVIVKRAKRLAKLIMREYGYPSDIDYSLEFNKYSEVYYNEESKSFIIDGDYELYGFKILNKKVSAKSYKDLYNKVFMELYLINPSILEELAKDNWRPGNARRPYLTNDINSVNKEDYYKVGNSVYVFNWFSKDSILYYIKLILDMYDNEVDVNDFCLLYIISND